MHSTETTTDPAGQTPLISNRFIAILTASVLVLAALSVGISLFGHTFGERWALAGHSDSIEPVEISIGLDHLRLSANTIRFEEQRKGGPSERVDLYLLWPEMAGYSLDNRRRFDDLARANSLIFLQLSQSTMSRDMSGRVEPIYAHLFDGTEQEGPFGLKLHHFRTGTGYDDEVLLTAARPGKPDYAVRCLLPAPGAAPSGGDCQRDIHVGRDLTVLYRFSSELLSDWPQIDSAIEAYIRERIITGPTPTKVQKRANPATNDSL